MSYKHLQVFSFSIFHQVALLVSGIMFISRYGTETAAYAYFHLYAKAKP
jgi:hypothetical protein